MVCFAYTSFQSSKPGFSKRKDPYKNIATYIYPASWLRKQNENLNSPFKVRLITYPMQQQFGIMSETIWVVSFNSSTMPAA